MTHSNLIADNHLSYCPVPLYNDLTMSPFSQKMDLNLYCIKYPNKTCFIRVTNPNMIAWGIDIDDVLVVEKQEQLCQRDLVVLKQQEQFQLYEYVGENQNGHIFFALDSKQQTLKVTDWNDLPIVGTVTNTIHQIKRNKAHLMA